jgi:hypothetical protein
MRPKISESDWKIFRQVRAGALERFCERVLSEVSRLAAEPGRSGHQRYLAVFELLQKQDKQLADTFDNPRRSTAFLQLLRMRYEDLLTEEELARFSPETRARVQGVLDPDD